jgi:hypothetical protein
VIETVLMFAKRSNALIFHHAPPFVSLLNKTKTPQQEIEGYILPIINYVRKTFNMTVYVTLDITDGLDRSKEAPGLREMNRTLADPEVQKAYVEYAVAMSELAKPDNLGLAAETNLIRLVAPQIYPSVVKATHLAAAQLNTTQRLYVSLQVETARGRLPPGPFLGVAQDVIDFEFVSLWGLSSYPYLGIPFIAPENLPLDYYSALNLTLPFSIVEGGWASQGPQPNASQIQQAQYIGRLAEILQKTPQMEAVFQLLFADLNMTAYFPTDPPSRFSPFVTAGLVEDDLTPKMALKVWDEQIAK